MSTEREKKENNVAQVRMPSQLGKPTGWKKWLFRLIAMTFVPAALLGLLELCLWTFSYGYATSFFIHRAAGARSIYAENVHFSKRFFPPTLVVRPPTISVPTDKTQHSYRIVVLGESAAMGFPDPSLSFSRILEVMLREAYPETQFEIINTAFTAINSHVVLPIARECAELQPDLFIVHLGNNEVVGPFGAAGVLGQFSFSRQVIRANLALKTTRTGQLLGDVMRISSSTLAPKRWDGMATFADSEVAANDSRLNATRANFRRNLADICHVGVDAGAEVVVCTIPVNLKDSAPFKSLHRTDLMDDESARWEESYQEGVRQEAAGQLAEALHRYQAAADIDDQFAALHFRMARCFLEVEDAASAKRHYQLACDLDALRFRTDSGLNQVIREVVEARSKRVHLVDAEEEFAAIAPAGIPGDDLFLEHVHMTFKGNHALASSLFRAIVAILPASVQRAREGGGAPASQSYCAARLAFGPWSRLKTARAIRRMLYGPPFNQQLDVADVAERWDDRIAALQSELTPETWKSTLSLYEQAFANDPDDWRTRENCADLLYNSGNLVLAENQYEQVVRQVPHHYRAHLQLGKLLLARGDPARAITHFERALLLVPDWHAVQQYRAKALAAIGRYDEGLAILRRQVQLEPDRAEALALLADFLIGQGRDPEARKTLSEGLRESPDNASLHIVMGNLRLEEGDREDAIAHYELALRLRPCETPRLAGFLDNLKNGGEPAQGSAAADVAEPAEGSAAASGADVAEPAQGSAAASGANVAEPAEGSAAACGADVAEPAEGSAAACGAGRS